MGKSPIKVPRHFGGFMKVLLIFIIFLAFSSAQARGVDKSELLNAMQIERGQCQMENVPDGGKNNFYFTCTGRTTHSVFEVWLEGVEEDEIAGYGESVTFDGRVRKDCGVTGKVQSSGKVVLTIECIVNN